VGPHPPVPGAALLTQAAPATRDCGFANQGSSSSGRLSANARSNTSTSATDSNTEPNAYAASRNGSSSHRPLAC